MAMPSTEQQRKCFEWKHNSPDVKNSALELQGRGEAWHGVAQIRIFAQWHGNGKRSEGKEKQWMSTDSRSIEEQRTETVAKNKMSQRRGQVK